MFRFPSWEDECQSNCCCIKLLQNPLRKGRGNPFKKWYHFSFNYNELWKYQELCTELVCWFSQTLTAQQKGWAQAIVYTTLYNMGSLLPRGNMFDGQQCKVIWQALVGEQVVESSGLGVREILWQADPAAAEQLLKSFARSFLLVESLAQCCHVLLKTIHPGRRSRRDEAVFQPGRLVSKTQRCRGVKHNWRG